MSGLKRYEYNDLPPGFDFIFYMNNNFVPRGYNC